MRFSDIRSSYIPKSHAREFAMKRFGIAFVIVSSLILTGCYARASRDMALQCAGSGASGFDYSRARYIQDYSMNRASRYQGHRVNCVYVPHSSMSDSDLNAHIGRNLGSNFSNCRGSRKIQVCRVYRDPNTNHYRRVPDF